MKSSFKGWHPSTVFFLTAVYAFSGAAGLAEAKRGPSPFHITGHLLRPTYHHEFSTPQIEAMGHLKAPSRASQEPGLTVYENEISMHYEMGEAAHSLGGPFQVWAKSIFVDFSITRMEVYVSSQYPVGSCQYRAILHHENNHVAINERVFKKYRAVLERELKHLPIPTQSHPLTVASASEGERILDSRLNPVWQRVNEECYAETRKQNAKIDTPANYARVQAKCKNW